MSPESRTKALVVAGTHSGCGKTLAGLALVAAFTRRGLKVQPFKAGPDFIDPGWHQAVTGRASHNLDGWIMGQDGVRSVFGRHARGADLALVEGVMGLYDGASATDGSGSTAEIARWLDADVALVVDARAMARSAAALAQGFLDFEPEPRISWLLFNRVGSGNHAALLRESLVHARKERNLPCPRLACLGRDEALTLPSRHLGLVTATDNPLSKENVEHMADWIEAGLDLDELLESLRPVALDVAVRADQEPGASPQHQVRIGVARDAAFCFYYEENLRLLRRAGAEIVEFSPLADAALPLDLDGIYLGGGYPELHAEILAGNTEMRDGMKRFAASGRPVYAECGGFMYLMRELRAHGRAFPMAGVFAMDCAMLDRRKALGYREVATGADSLLGPAGTRLRGHEFHYSEPLGLDADARPIYMVKDRAGNDLPAEGLAKMGVLGSYVHLHFASHAGAAEAFVARCARSAAP